MVVKSFYGSSVVLKADVVEASEGSTVDVFNLVIRHQEELLQ